MSSNVIQTTDQTGKLKWQNLDSAFGGKLEDLLTLGAGEVKAGVVVAQPAFKTTIAVDQTAVKVPAGSYGLIYLSASNTSPCAVDLSEVVLPIGATVAIIVEGAGNVTFDGHGFSGTSINGSLVTVISDNYWYTY